MRSLYDISDDLAVLEEALTESAGEVDEELDAWFDRIGEERDAKVRNYCALIANFDVSAKACQEEAARLTAMAKARENAAKRLKERLQLFFLRHGINKLDLGIFKPRIQANGGVAPLIVPEKWEQNPEYAPEIFQKQVILLDKEQIRRTVEDFNEKAEEFLAPAKTASERFALYETWLQSNPVAAKTKEAIAGCSIGARGVHLRLR